LFTYTRDRSKFRERLGFVKIMDHVTRLGFGNVKHISIDVRVLLGGRHFVTTELCHRFNERDENFVDINSNSFHLNNNIKKSLTVFFVIEIFIQV